ncbi:MAG: hypothetical protein M1540_09910 [Candidatus Bathyarchaeota archaeon]|nr:hypothetical protein [Candidatus Bathyarchaeota archaeon]
MDFEDIKEEWNEYKLKDGSTLKVRLVLKGVKRLKKFNPDGTPIYLINASNVVRVLNIPAELKTTPKVSSFQQG